MVPAEGVKNILGTDGWFECDEQLRPPTGKVASVSESLLVSLVGIYASVRLCVIL